MILPPDRGLTVHSRHMRSARLCVRGSREWFAANNLDWRSFLQNGILETRIREIGDPVPFGAILAAHREADGQ